jgi:hypothetical protein
MHSTFRSCDRKICAAKMVQATKLDFTSEPRIGNLFGNLHLILMDESSHPNPWNQKGTDKNCNDGAPEENQAFVSETDSA